LKDLDLMPEHEQFDVALPFGGASYAEDSAQDQVQQ